MLLDIGANINVKDSEGRTPLHLAVMQNYPVGVQLLLDNQARIFRDKDGKRWENVYNMSDNVSPLDYATSKEMQYILKNLCPPTKEPEKPKQKPNTTLYDELTGSEGFAQISQDVVEFLKDSNVCFFLVSISNVLGFIHVSSSNWGDRRSGRRRARNCAQCASSETAISVWITVDCEWVDCTNRIFLV